MSQLGSGSGVSNLGPGWRVTQVVNTTAADATGKYTTGKQVSFVLDSGVTGTIFAPDGQDNPAAVKAAIMAEAAKLDQIANLTQNS
jgi:hypothetical protein